MRFARRCEGILSARLVFKLARDDPRVGYQVYVSAALMEYFCSKVRPRSITGVLIYFYIHNCSLKEVVNLHKT